MLTLLTNLPRDVLIRQLQDGLVLLVLGMGFVFIFLAILVFTTKWISKLCMKVAPAKQPEVKKAPAQPPRNTMKMVRRVFDTFKNNALLVRKALNKPEKTNADARFANPVVRI